MRKCLPAAVASGLWLLMVGAPQAHAAKLPLEPYSALRTQIRTGQVVRARILPKRHIARVTLRNGKKFRVPIPAGQQPSLVASLRANGARVHVNKKKRRHAAGHRLRYIALGVVVLGLLAGGAVLLARRRRRPQAEPQPPPSAGHPPPSG